MDIPEDRRYTDQHEWALLEASGVRLGITDYAQEALGEVVFVRLPEVGRRVAAGDTIADIDSTKSVAEVYAPMDGIVDAINEALPANTQWVNDDPYGKGWFALIAPDDPGAIENLLDAAAYRALTGQ
ncbi:MAG: glycine cleavage system protein GcvH [Acidimicrobiia bacterium]|nr:glycine cleavage system protein GcvH [Acidimicrobiia bacterium]